MARDGAVAVRRTVVAGGGAVVGAAAVVGGAAVVDVVLVLVVVVPLAATQRNRLRDTGAVDAPTTAAEHAPAIRSAADAPAMARLTSDRVEPGPERRRMTESNDEEPMRARYRRRALAESRRRPAATE